MSRNILTENVSISLSPSDDIQTALNSMPNTIDGCVATINLAGNSTTPVTYALSSGLTINKTTQNGGYLVLSAAAGSQTDTITANGGGADWIEFFTTTPADYEGLWVGADIRILSVGVEATNGAVGTNVGQGETITGVTQPTPGTIRVSIAPATWNVDFASAGDVGLVKFVLNSCIIDKSADTVMSHSEGWFIPNNIEFKGKSIIGNYNCIPAVFGPRSCIFADSLATGIDIIGVNTVFNSSYTFHVVNAAAHGLILIQNGILIGRNLDSGGDRNYISGNALNGIASDTSNLAGTVNLRNAILDRNGDWGVFIAGGNKAVVRTTGFYGTLASNSVRILSVDNSSVYTNGNYGDHSPTTDQISSNGGVFL